MITFSGVQMHPGCGRSPEPIDIAVGMCRITRYAGAIWVPLAAHSLIVAELAVLHDKDDFVWACGLLHDAHETVTGEVTRHYKPREMKPFERELDEAIFKHFGLDYHRYRQNEEFLKEMDEKALTAEALQIGLKEWPSYYQKREGRRVPALTDTEHTIASKILQWWRDYEMVDEHSKQVEALTACLELVRRGEVTEARKHVSPVAPW